MLRAALSIRSNLQFNVLPKGLLTSTPLPEPQQTQDIGCSPPPRPCCTPDSLPGISPPRRSTFTEQPGAIIPIIVIFVKMDELALLPL